MKPMDLAMKQIEENQAFAEIHLDNQAKKIELLDTRIRNYEKQISALEVEKQSELDKMMGLMEMAVTLTYTRVNGYTVSYDTKRKMKVADAAQFLHWLKRTCTTSEVLEFFSKSLKVTELKKFVEKKCDEQRAKGIMNPEVDGINLQEITFRRLTTFYKEKENGK